MQTPLSTLRRSWVPRLLLTGALLAGVLLTTLAPPVLVQAAAQHQHGPSGASPAASLATATSSSPAADLRVALNNLLAEHVYLAARATGAALGGQTAAFEAAAESLDNNSVDLSKAIGAAYGPRAEAAFLPLWRSHIAMFVDYTLGLAAKDDAKQQKAVAGLLQYTEDFAAFLASANENLPQPVVSELLKVHILTLKDVADTQAAGSPAAHFAAVRHAAMHMSGIGDPLAEATVLKFPDRFAASGEPSARTMPAEIQQFAQSHSFSFAFNQPGEYAYYCTRHQSMQRVVIVS